MVIEKPPARLARAATSPDARWGAPSRIGEGWVVVGAHLSLFDGVGDLVETANTLVSPAANVGKGIEADCRTLSRELRPFCPPSLGTPPRSTELSLDASGSLPHDEAARAAWEARLVARIQDNASAQAALVHRGMRAERARWVREDKAALRRLDSAEAWVVRVKFLDRPGHGAGGEDACFNGRLLVRALRALGAKGGTLLAFPGPGVGLLQTREDRFALVMGVRIEVHRGPRA